MINTFKADFSTRDTVLRDFFLQAKDDSRMSLVPSARTGKNAVQLHTEPGDHDIAFSGNMERCDLYHRVPGSEEAVTFGEGDEIYVAHSIMFPDEFKQPLWHSYVVFDFHPVGKAIQANMHLNFRGWKGRPDLPGLLSISRYFGNPDAPSERYVTLGVPTRNVWYDFVHHYIWSSGAGIYECWLNKTHVTTQIGPTLYDDGERVYMKLPNYHLPWPADQPDVPSSVIHDLVRIGPTKASVAV